MIMAGGPRLRLDGFDIATPRGWRLLSKLADIFIYLLGFICLMAVFITFYLGTLWIIHWSTHTYTGWLFLGYIALCVIGHCLEEA